jgi:hypothetical protein
LNPVADWIAGGFKEDLLLFVTASASSSQEINEASHLKLSQ